MNTLAYTAFSSIVASSSVPFKHVEASVTLHDGRPEQEVWNNGLQSARQRAMPLIARADIPVLQVRNCKDMDVVHDPIKDLSHPENDNPHHAEITGWAADKAAQKNAAITILAGIKAKLYQSTLKN